MLRIGVNLGEVIGEGSDIYGEGVNIAARLEGLAEPGGICISAKVFEEVRGKLDQPFDDLGEHALKNIVRPVRIYRLRTGGAGGGGALPRPPAALPRQAVDRRPAVPEHEWRSRAGVFR